jgi:hypothetical protein
MTGRRDSLYSLIKPSGIPENMNMWILLPEMLRRICKQRNEYKENSNGKYQ